MNGHGYIPDADHDAAGHVTACRETRCCYAVDGAYCHEAAACEVLDVRCQRLWIDNACDGRCSRCRAAVNHG